MRQAISDNRSDRSHEVARASGMPRFRFRIGTMLFVVAILALLMVVIIQQVQFNRARARMEVQQAEIAQLAARNQQLLRPRPPHRPAATVDDTAQPP
jgi:cell division protein FtsB